MLWLAAAVIAASAPTSAPPAPVAVQARASVRILSGVRLNFDGRRNEHAPPPHDAAVREGGAVHHEKLIEFE